MSFKVAEIVTKSFLKCPSCHSCDQQIRINEDREYKSWSCSKCGIHHNVSVKDKVVILEKTGLQNLPVTVTLRYRNDPNLQIAINDWVYKHKGSKEYSWEEEVSSKQYYYDEHTCPTNYLRVDKVILGEDDDPHGVFEFVKMENGHSV